LRLFSLTNKLASKGNILARQHDTVANGNTKLVVAFKDGKYISVLSAWQHGLNEERYRHCLTVSLGNGLSVSEQHMKGRLKYIALRLKRRIWGNDKRDQRKIEFLAFMHSGANKKHKNKRGKEIGSRQWSVSRQQELVNKHHQSLGKRYQSSKPKSHEHYHVLMHIRGRHGWSDREIADAIDEIEQMRNKRPCEKDIHLDFDWFNQNRFHGYVASEADQEERKTRKKLKNGRWADFIVQRDKWLELIM
jgi:hypothetical protein